MHLKQRAGKEKALTPKGPLKQGRKDRKRETYNGKRFQGHCGWEKDL